MSARHRSRSVRLRRPRPRRRLSLSAPPPLSPTVPPPGPAGAWPPPAPCPRHRPACCPFLMPRRHRALPGPSRRGACRPLARPRSSPLPAMAGCHHPEWWPSRPALMRARGCLPPLARGLPAPPRPWSRRRRRPRPRSVATLPPVPQGRALFLRRRKARRWAPNRSCPWPGPVPRLRRPVLARRSAPARRPAVRPRRRRVPARPRRPVVKTVGHCRP